MSSCRRNSSRVQTIEDEDRPVSFRNSHADLAGTKIVTRLPCRVMEWHGTHTAFINTDSNVFINVIHNAVKVLQ